MNADVSIDEPARNQTISGKNVVVRGSASATLGQLSRVEITLAGITKVKTASPSSSIDYEVSFDVSTVPPGETSLQVVACGAFSLAGSLARGEAEIPVRIAAPAGATTTTTVVSRTSVVPAPGSSIPGAGATTTSVAVTTTRAGQAATASSSTTVTSAPTPAQDAPPVTQARTDAARPGALDAPIVLTDAPEEGSSGPPLWVGAVVGISGGLGLLFSAKSRRGSRMPEVAVPVAPAESDLVDVR